MCMRAVQLLLHASSLKGSRAVPNFWQALAGSPGLQSLHITFQEQTMQTIKAQVWD